MDKKQLAAYIKKFVKDMGADMVGVAPVSRYDGAPHMLRPQAHLPEAKSVICFGVHHPDASVDWCGEPNPNFPAAFQIGMIPKLDDMCYRLTRELKKLGYTVVPQPCTTYWRHRYYKDIPYEHAASWSHMSAFVLCGLGEYGYHGMVMSPEYGVRERVISLITDADIEPDPLYNGPALCDNCMACARHCPGQNYKPERLNDPAFIEFTVEGKTFKYPNINRWRCFFGEQAHLDMRELPKFDVMTEETIYDCINQNMRQYGEGGAGYMCNSFKYCMTPGKRTWDRKYTPNARRKKELSDISKEEMLAHIKELAIEAGAEMIAIQPLSDFVDKKKNFSAGFRVDQFFDFFTTVITVGRYGYGFTDEDELNKRNKRHLADATVDRMGCNSIDVSRYLDDLGYEAIQDWFHTGIARQAAKNAGWERDDKRLFLSSVICNIPFDFINERLRDWNDDCVPNVTLDLPIMRDMDKISVADVDTITFEGMDAFKEKYPTYKRLVAVAAEIPERVTELACDQEAEDGCAYAYMHYATLKSTMDAAQDLVSTLEAKGYNAIPMSDMTADSYLTIGKFGRHMPDLRANAPFAAAAGLGEIGKSGMSLTPEFGPRVRYAFVLTDAPLNVTSYEPKSLCVEGCTACAAACPMCALDVNKTETVTINATTKYDVMKRDETRCAWARSLAMCEGAGSGQQAWVVPDMECPDELTNEYIEKARAAKDPIQTLCYQNPNFIDIIIERCLQACPVGKTKK